MTNLYGNSNKRITYCDSQFAAICEKKYVFEIKHIFFRDQNNQKHQNIYKKSIFPSKIFTWKNRFSRPNFDFSDFSRTFFLISKKYFFSELKKKVGYSFDVEFRDLSIADVFRVIRALLLPENNSFLKKGFLYHQKSGLGLIFTSSSREAIQLFCTTGLNQKHY